MYVALDKEGLRVYIEEAEKNEDYFCPVCRGKLRVRKGDIREYHFAHLSGVCEDNWNYDMSEWHMEWQERFPKECREVVVINNGLKHRADVLAGNTVIEFQHSTMSCGEFQERNSFYNKAGYKVVWIFDMQDLYDNENIFNNPRKDDDHSWIWNWAHSTFSGFHPENKSSDVLLFFQLENNRILHVKWFSPENNKYFRTDNKDFWSNKDVVAALSKYREQRKETGFCIADLIDPIYSYGTDPIEFQDAVILNCPKGHAIIEDCLFCPHFSDDGESRNCSAKFADVMENWESENDKVLNITKDQYGIVREIKILKDGKEYTHTYPASKVGEPLSVLINRTKSVCIIVKNNRTNYEFKIGTKYYQQHPNAKIEGCYRKGGEINFSKNRRKIFYAHYPEWVIMWESSQKL